MKLLNDMIDGNKIVITDTKATKAIKMKSFFIMAEKTYEAVQKDEGISHAEMLDYAKVQKYVKKHSSEIFGAGTRFKINVLTDMGWRSGDFFGKNENADWFDPVRHYDDERAEIDEIYMIQILSL